VHEKELPAHLTWITGSEAKGGVAVMGRIGARDRGRQVWPLLVERTDGPWWPTAFAQYLHGWRNAPDPSAGAALDALIERRGVPAAGLVDAAVALVDQEGSQRTTARIRDTIAGAAQDRVELVRRVAWGLRWQQLTEEDFRDLVTFVHDHTPATRRALVGVLAARHAAKPLAADLQEATWQILEETFTGEGMLKHEWDELAASLGERAPGRLLKLVKKLLETPALETSSLDHEVPQVWEVLTGQHRAELLELLVQREAEAEAPAWIGSTLEALIQGCDRTLVGGIVSRLGVSAARIIALALDAESPGFWDIARDLIAAHGDDALVRERLAVAVTSGTWSGTALGLVDERSERIATLRDDPHHHVKVWANRVVNDLAEWRRRAEREHEEDWMWDARIRRAEMKELVHSDDSTQRLWAIGRLLEDGPEERVRELLRPEAILEALPQLPQLDATTRSKWERWARFHAGRPS
jgi:hypothetical protein